MPNTLTESNESDETAAYTAFITALVDMVKRQKRIVATEKDVENEKYAFRCLHRQLPDAARFVILQEFLLDGRL